MIFAIQDANIIIDLHNTGLLENYFALENDTHTTDLVLQEVRHDVEKYIQRGDLKVKTFTAVELQQLLAFKATQPSSLSLEDCSVFQFAIEKGAILLTGETTLRNCSKRANVEAHGIIWLLDLTVLLLNALARCFSNGSSRLRLPCRPRTGLRQSGVHHE